MTMLSTTSVTPLVLRAICSALASSAGVLDGARQRDDVIAGVDADAAGLDELVSHQLRLDAGRDSGVRLGAAEHRTRQARGDRASNDSSLRRSSLNAVRAMQTRAHTYLIARNAPNRCVFNTRPLGCSGTGALLPYTPSIHANTRSCSVGAGATLVSRGGRARRARAREVLVEIKAAGVRHSDLHPARGDWPIKTPLVLGHEGAGIVREVGPSVTKVRPGDHVVLCWAPACGVCPPCREGRAVLCDRARKRTTAIGCRRAPPGLHARDRDVRTVPRHRLLL